MNTPSFLLRLKTKVLFVYLFFVILAFSANAASIDFESGPVRVGKQLLTENAYYVRRSLGMAKFSPEAEIPIFLVYKSDNKESGLFGAGWSSPFLESSMEGDLWHTPWGETIQLPDSRFELEDRLICGKNEFYGWRFLYLFGSLQEIVTPDQVKITFLYENPNSSLSQVRVGQSNFIHVKMEKDRVSNLVISGVPTELSYQNGYLKTIRSNGLFPVDFRYDSSHRLIQIKQKDVVDNIKIGADGRIASDAEFTYSGKRFHIAAQDKSGMKHEIDFQDGMLTRKTGEKETIVEYLSKDNGDYPRNPLSMIAGGVKVFQIEYDKEGRPVKKTDRYGNQTLTEYDEEGNAVKISRKWNSEKEPLVLKTVEYDRWHNPVSYVLLNSDGSVKEETTLKYDDEFRLIQKKSGDKIIRYQYNKYGYLTSLGTESGSAREYLYDEHNRKIAEISGQIIQYAYNTAGFVTRRVTMSLAGQKLEDFSISYDSYGRPVSFALADGRTEQLEYDLLGRVRKQTRFDGSSVSFRYDDAGNMNAVTDPNGNTIVFDYKDGRLLKKTTPEGQVTEYAYDDHGNVVSEKTFLSDHPDEPGSTVKYRYNPNGSVASVDYGNGYVQTTEYDKNGMPASVARTSPEEKRTASLTYDLDGRLIRREETVDSLSGGDTSIYVYTYEFDEAGRRTRFAFRNGTEEQCTDYSYDENGRLQEILSGDDMIEFVYKNGELYQEIINEKQIITYSFDNLGRLISKKLGDLDLKYSWGRDGKLLSRTFNGKKVLYQYDKLDQLVAVVDASGDASGFSGKELESYTYDPAGNILRQTVGGIKSEFQYDKANQLVSGDIGGKKYKYRYDSAGRMTADGHSEWKYGWKNSVVECDGKKYTYDVEGHLASDGTDLLFWDDLSLIERGGTRILNSSALTGGNPFLVGDKIVFHDHTGSSLGVVENGKASVVQRSSFGQAEAAKDIDFYTGKPYVAGLGYSFLYRNYHAGTNRWTSSDPFGYPDGWNNYSYALNMPNSNMDPTGGSVTAAALAGVAFLLKCYTAYKVTEQVTGKIIIPSAIDLVEGTNYSDATVLSAMPELLTTAAAGGMGKYLNETWQLGKDIYGSGYAGDELGDALIETYSFLSDKYGYGPYVDQLSNGMENGLLGYLDEREYQRLLALAEQELKDALENAVAEEAGEELVEALEQRDDDPPAAVVRAFFIALSQGNIKVAESFIEPTTLEVARLWIDTSCMRADRVWIAPVAYFWANDQLSAVEYSFDGGARRNVVLGKSGSSWKMRIGYDSHPVSMPEDISDKNTKIGMIKTGEIRLPSVTVPVLEFRGCYIVDLKGGSGGNSGTQFGNTLKNFLGAGDNGKTGNGTASGRNNNSSEKNTEKHEDDDHEDETPDECDHTWERFDEDGNRVSRFSKEELEKIEESQKLRKQHKAEIDKALWEIQQLYNDITRGHYFGEWYQKLNLPENIELGSVVYYDKNTGKIGHTAVFQGSDSRDFFKKNTNDHIGRTTMREENGKKQWYQYDMKTREKTPCDSEWGSFSPGKNDMQKSSDTDFSPVIEQLEKENKIPLSLSHLHRTQKFDDGTSMTRGFSDQDLFVANNRGIPISVVKEGSFDGTIYDPIDDSFYNLNDKMNGLPQRDAAKEYKKMMDGIYSKYSYHCTKCGAMKGKIVSPRL